jgi:hypothetical protein
MQALFTFGAEDIAYFRQLQRPPLKPGQRINLDSIRQKKTKIGQAKNALILHGLQAALPVN